MTGRRVLVVGATGWLGSRIHASIPGAVAVSTRELLDAGPGLLRHLDLGGEPVIVNAAGAKRGSPDLLNEVNAELVAVLASYLEQSGGHLVHLGSASEYGLHQPHGLCEEDAECAPESDYGRTKLEGTRLALSGGRATVLRVFNILATPAQEGSPLEDITRRVAAGVAADAPVSLLSPRTVRDWVGVQDVLDSVALAATRRPIGVFNVCSGQGVAMGELAALASASLGGSVEVEDEGRVPASTVIGSPQRWREASGMTIVVGAQQVATAIAAAVRSGQNGGTGDARTR